MNRLLTCVVLLALVVGISPIFGQATDGNIIGTVTDQSGGVVAKATVDLESAVTGTKRTAETDSAGVYRFNNLLVGKYNVTVRAAGFTAVSLQNVDVVLNRATTANVTLAVGTVATQIEVTEASTLIDTTSATIGSSYNTQQALFNPMSSLGLGVYNLSLLGAGVGSSGGIGLGEGPSVGGQRPRQNNFMVEGVDNNRADVTGANIRVPSEAVAEFSMLQNQFTAEFGHSTGGQFNVALRSGTNAIHGSAYWTLENRKLNAIGAADARQGMTERDQMPRYDQNVVGGSVGGPVIKNKLFYYGLFEYNPLGQGSSPSSATYSPTAAGYSTLTAMSGLSKNNLDILKLYMAPAATATSSTVVKGVTIPTGILPIVFPNYFNQYNWLASADYNLSSSDQMRFRYIQQKGDGIDITTSPKLPAFSGGRPLRQKLLTFSEYHTFSPRFFNELRLAYSKFGDNLGAGDFQFPGLDVFPNITIEEDLNTQLGPLPEAPQGGVQNTYQIVNNTTWIRGSHSIKFGVDLRNNISPQVFSQRIRGDYGYTNLERYLLDLSPDIIAERNLGQAKYYGNKHDFYWYLQDEIRVKRNITLNLGLRHEYKGIPLSDNNHDLNKGSSVPGLIEFRAPKASWREFAPRIGVTYSPGGSGNTVIRAGLGMAYDVYFTNLGLNNKPPQMEATITRDPATTVADFLKNGGIKPTEKPDVMTPAEAKMFTSAYMPDQHLPYSIQWNIGAQHVFAKDYTVDVRYLGTKGKRLYVQQRINVRERATPAQSLPTYLTAPTQTQLNALTLTLDDLTTGANASYILPVWAAAGFNAQPIVSFATMGNSSYHGLASEITRRFSNGMQFKGAYTWSHAIDDSTADLFSTILTPRRPQSFQDWRSEKSTSALDRRHRATLSWYYEAQWLKGSSSWAAKNLAGNWTLAGTYMVESAGMATVQSGIDSNLNGDSAGDRAIVNVAGTDLVGSAVTALKNTAGKTVGYLATNPNARYIAAGSGVAPNAGRNSVPLKGINNWDFSLYKNFAIREGKTIQFHGGFYNFFNHPQYAPGSISTVGATSTNTLSRSFLNPGHADFMKVTDYFDSHPRSVQLSLRIQF
jgi:hypothetical protein